MRTTSALRLPSGLGEEVPSHVIIDFRLVVLLLLNGFALTAVLLLRGLQSNRDQFALPWTRAPTRENGQGRQQMGKEKLTRLTSAREHGDRREQKSPAHRRGYRDELSRHFARWCHQVYSSRRSCSRFLRSAVDRRGKGGERKLRIKKYSRAQVPLVSLYTCARLQLSVSQSSLLSRPSTRRKGQPRRRRLRSLE